MMVVYREDFRENKGVAGAAYLEVNHGNISSKRQETEEQKLFFLTSNRTSGSQRI